MPRVSLQSASWLFASCIQATVDQRVLIMASSTWRTNLSLQVHLSWEDKFCPCQIWVGKLNWACHEHLGLQSNIWLVKFGLNQYWAVHCVTHASRSLRVTLCMFDFKTPLVLLRASSMKVKPRCGILIRSMEIIGNCTHNNAFALSIGVIGVTLV